MGRLSDFLSNPFSFLSTRSSEEDRLATYVIREHGRGRALAYCGRHSIVVYLAFPLFIGPTRVLLLKVLPMWLADMAALVTTAAGVIGALLLFRLVRDTPMGFLFVRPKIVASITSQPRAT